MALVVIGPLWPVISKLGFGRLPGDIVIERKNFRLYIPLATSIIFSGMLCLLLWLLNRGDMRRPLLIIDGNSFAHRAYHALLKSILRRHGDKGAGAILGVRSAEVRPPFSIGIGPHSARALSRSRGIGQSSFHVLR